MEIKRLKINQLNNKLLETKLLFLFLELAASVKHDVRRRNHGETSIKLLSTCFSFLSSRFLWFSPFRHVVSHFQKAIMWSTFFYSFLYKKKHEHCVLKVSIIFETHESI